MYTKDQYNSWYAVKQAINTGKLVRPESCQRCHRKPGKNKAGRALIQAHHHKGYDRPNRLNVIFLCPNCHVGYKYLRERPPHIQRLLDTVQMLSNQRILQGAPSFTFKKPWD